MLVSGAARGIGAAVVRRFAADGWRVGAYDVDEDGVRRLAAELDGVVAGGLDVTCPDSWQAAVAAFTQEAGPLDVLVNNAGLLTTGPLAEVPLARQAAVVDVNVKGVLYGCATALPHLRRGGCVVNVSSASALYGQPDLATYSATKAAVSALTEALDLEWRPHGVRVVDVRPLFVGTAMGEQVAGLASARALGVRLTPDGVARAVHAAALVPGRRGAAPHRAVGWQARLLSASSAVTPPRLSRLLVARLAR